jgi:hypothetical protein
LLHSSPHISQTEAQAWQIVLANSLPLAMKPAATRQSWAQSISKAIQRAIAFGSCSRKHAAAHRSHASAQSLQALIHDANWLSIIILPRGKLYIHLQDKWRLGVKQTDVPE